MELRSNDFIEQLATSKRLHELQPNNIIKQVAALTQLCVSEGFEPGSTPGAGSEPAFYCWTTTCLTYFLVN